MSDKNKTTIKNIPKIIIKYNRFLDPIFIFYCKNNPELKKHGWNDWIPPEKEKILERVKNYKEEWGKQGIQVLQEMCGILNLNFQRNVIDVHIVSGNPRGFSEPIIIKSGFSPEEFVDTLSHELIHVLFQDNIEKVPVSILSEMFPQESQLTRNHIITHSVLKYIYLEVLKGEPRLNKNIKKSSDASGSDYSHAWEIVEKRGYRELIDEFKNKYRPRNQD